MGVGGRIGRFILAFMCLAGWHDFDLKARKCNECGKHMRRAR